MRMLPEQTGKANADVDTTKEINANRIVFTQTSEEFHD